MVVKSFIEISQTCQVVKSDGTTLNCTLGNPDNENDEVQGEERFKPVIGSGGK